MTSDSDIPPIHEFIAIYLRDGEEKANRWLEEQQPRLSDVVKKVINELVTSGVLQGKAPLFRQKILPW